jgi:two-component system sensor histidine kinase BarA
MNSPELPFQHHILLIEDDNVSLFAAAEILSHLTAMVDIARDVEEAKEHLATTPYDIVICDINLPDGTGLDIIQYARTYASSENKKTPFIALTAHQDGQKHQTILASGFHEIIIKPLSQERAYLSLEHYHKQSENKSTEEEFPIIDLMLGMKRMGANKDEKAVIAIGLLLDSLKEDLQKLKDFQLAEDTNGIREVLHKIRGGLDYSGVPRLQNAINNLHSAMQESNNVVAMHHLFDVVYEQVSLLTLTYQELLLKRRGDLS